MDEYRENGIEDVADALMEALDNQRRKSWMDKTEGLNFTYSSRKALILIRRLGSTQEHALNQTIKPTANNITEHLIKSSKGTVDKHWSTKVKSQLRKENRDLPHASLIGKEIIKNELETALASTKKSKSTGLDGILPEFLLNLGPAAKRYLISLYSNIIKTGHLPRQFKETKIVALKKRGKDGSIPAHFRQVTLLSCSFKLFEHIIHNRIQPLIDKVLPIEQAGFRSCCEQVLTLTYFIEARYQKYMKTGAVLIDLSSAYDSV